MTISQKFTQEINHINQILREKYHPEKIILFGSFGFGKINKDSDIDLLIVKNSKFKKRRERIRQVSNLFLDRKIPIDFIVLTEDELEQEKKNNPVMRNILNTSKILYEKARV